METIPSKDKFFINKNSNDLVDELKRKKFTNHNILDCIKKIPRDKLMPKRGTLSIEKAKSILNYTPRWSIDKAYPEYIKWYLNFYKKNN